jgi:hypothetical protein
MANAHFKVGGRTIEVFGPRAEQVAHLLELDSDESAQKLARRIGSHVADGERGEDVLELSEGEQRDLLEALDRVAAATKNVPGDLAELRTALGS